MFATGPPALEALAPYAPTPLRLARPLARTTRTRNETETDFPIELIPSISDFTYQIHHLGWFAKEDPHEWAVHTPNTPDTFKYSTSQLDRNRSHLTALAARRKGLPEC